MKSGIKLFTLLCLTCFFIIDIQAQEVVTTAGGYGSSASAKVIWTIGEPVTETVTGTNSILTQGFNQGDLIITIIKDPEIPGFNIIAYPNPATENLKISFGIDEIENLEYVLYNMRGQVVKNDLLTGTESEIRVVNLAPGTYFLKIFQNNTELSTIKIIKY